MKKINLHFKGLGYCNTFQADVYVYKDNICIFKKKTYNGSITIPLEENNLYRIKAISNGEIINKNIYLSCKDLYICFAFQRAIVRNMITFYLTDSNYRNLKIMKGEIILWEK